jgi:hypothetical protein
MSDSESNNQHSIADQIEEIKRQDLSGNWVAVGKARRMMFWIAVLLFIGEMMGMYEQFDGFDTGVFMIALLEAAAFIMIGIWTKKKPYTAVMTGLIIFVVMLIFSAYQGLEMGAREGIAKSLVSGALVKLIIFVTLIKAVNDARELQKAQKS